MAAAAGSDLLIKVLACVEVDDVLEASSTYVELAGLADRDGNLFDCRATTV